MKIKDAIKIHFLEKKTLLGIFNLFLASEVVMAPGVESTSKGEYPYLEEVREESAP